MINFFTDVFDGYFSQFETCFVKQEEDTSDNDKKGIQKEISNTKQ